MHIPLDYYRILGLPIQATPEQLRQAHRDRTTQLPRREYSEVAIASRRYLLDRAYEALSDPDERRAYDAKFLSKTYEMGMEGGNRAQETGEIGTETVEEAATPSIEIPDEHLVGALLILQELGEYEFVLKVGRPFLTGGTASLKNGQFGDPNLVAPDLVLTVALACLELGREQWQQGQYENAAEALETGQQLLLREGLFAGVRGEIQSDLYRLRPYRTLELLALPETESDDRARGLHLLQDMLQERGGIDGNGNDQSGLSMDDFLRFIQQLRSYMMASEQQALFQKEADRPSAVATYLAVYALLARGFHERQPVLIRQAKSLLTRLASRQDVHLEQAVCSLLLGQTDQANQSLEQSQEYEPIAFIREQSQSSPDLLPGLCLYAERWLQDEVFPHFRDLANQPAQLKDYFADTGVQTYLETLVNESEAIEETGIVSRGLTGAAALAGLSAASLAQSGLPLSGPMVGQANRTEDPWDGDRDSSASALTLSTPSSTPLVPGSSPDLGEPSASTEETSLASRHPEAVRNLSANQRRARRGSTDLSAIGGLPWAAGLWQSWPVRLGALLVAGLLLGWLFKSCQSSQPAATASRTDAQIGQPSSNTSPNSGSTTPGNPVPSPTASPAAAEMTKESAKESLNLWFAAKQAAMGADHDTGKLGEILTGEALSNWQTFSGEAKKDGFHKVFKQDAVTVDLVEVDPTNPNAVKVVAEVSESEEYCPGERCEPVDRQPERFQYNFVKQDGQWRIAKIQSAQSGQ